MALHERDILTNRQRVVNDNLNVVLTSSTLSSTLYKFDTTTAKTVIISAGLPEGIHFYVQQLGTGIVTIDGTAVTPNYINCLAIGVQSEVRKLYHIGSNIWNITRADISGVPLVSSGGGGSSLPANPSTLFSYRRLELDTTGTPAWSIDKLIRGPWTGLPGQAGTGVVNGPAGSRASDGSTDMAIGLTLFNNPNSHVMILFKDGDTSSQAGNIILTGTNYGRMSLNIHIVSSGSSMSSQLLFGWGAADTLPAQSSTGFYFEMLGTTLKTVMRVYGNSYYSSDSVEITDTKFKLSIEIFEETETAKFYVNNVLFSTLSISRQYVLRNSLAPMIRQSCIGGTAGDLREIEVGAGEVLYKLK